MLKKALIGGLVLLLAGGAALFVLARSILGQDTVRTALAAQLSTALGQPVSIEGISAGVYPRVTVRLEGVRIGDPVRADIRTLHVGAALRALLSRRIEDAGLLLEDARIELPFPLPDLSSPSTGSDSGPVQLVSIDEIVLRNVQIVSGGRTLNGDVELGPRDNGLEIRRLVLNADDMSISATGVLTDLTGPAGELSVDAGALDFNALLAFVADFQAGSGIGGVTNRPAEARAAEPPSAASGMDITVAMQADRATLGDLALANLSGRARITRGQVALEPIAFRVFDGTYDGALVLTLDETPSFHLTADLAGVDVAAATAFAGTPDTVSGRLSGRLDLTGRGMDGASVAESARGTVRFDVVDGVVRRLGLVRAIVLATAMRAQPASAADAASSDESFRTLGATFAVENGLAQTGDLRFESPDLTVTAQGAIGLDGDPISLTGRVQLSEALTRQGGTDLARYTQEQGRVTLPVSISGSASGLSVRIDVGDMMQRAIRNRAEEETRRAIERGIGGLLR